MTAVKELGDIYLTASFNGNHIIKDGTKSRIMLTPNTDSFMRCLFALRITTGDSELVYDDPYEVVGIGGNLYLTIINLGYI